jgi:hypothetical protein
MSTTVWVRINPSVTNAAALTANDAIPAILPLIIRLHKNQPGDILEEFSLPYNPIQVQYGQFGDEITQIPRPATTPIVAFKSHRLMTIDFTFILAQPGDGLATSVDDKLQILRRFAASGHRLVSLENFDALTNQPHQFRNSFPEARTDGLFFNIVDMSVDVLRRNRNNQISQANISISLVENRNPKINVQPIPALVAFVPPGLCKNGKKQRRTGTPCPENTPGGKKNLKRFSGQTLEQAIKNGLDPTSDEYKRLMKECVTKTITTGIGETTRNTTLIESCPG